MRATLPNRPDREALLAFWASLAVLAGLFLGVSARLAGDVSGATALALGAGVTVLLYLAGHWKERSIDRAYQLWSRAADRYAGLARGLVTRIWYWTVFSAVARTGGRGLDLDRSPWLVRETLSDSAYADPGGAHAAAGAGGGVRDFVGWALRSGRVWTLVLLPLFGLLRGLDTRSTQSVGSDIYTLY